MFKCSIIDTRGPGTKGDPLYPTRGVILHLRGVGILSLQSGRKMPFFETVVSQIWLHYDCWTVDKYKDNQRWIVVDQSEVRGGPVRGVEWNPPVLVTRRGCVTHRPNEEVAQNATQSTPIWREKDEVYEVLKSYYFGVGARGRQVKWTKDNFNLDRAKEKMSAAKETETCLLYTSDAADE